MSLTLIATMMQQDRLESVRRNLERVMPFVDCAVVTDNGSTDGTREWLEAQPKVVPVYRAWNDSFVAARNSYLRAADDIAKASDGPVWIAVADDDELFSDALLENLRAICEEAYYDDRNFLRVQSRSVETDWKGDVCWSHLDDWHKGLIFLWESGIRYVGIGNSEVHEDLVIPSGKRIRDLSHPLSYDHVKAHGAIWLRGIRNFFAGGGGPNLGESNPLWRPFRKMVADLTGGAVTTAAEFVKYLQAGQAHQDVLDWFKAHRLLGTKFDDTPPMWSQHPDGTSELREGFLAYHLFLHPETMPLDLIEADREYLDYKTECLTIHGPKSPEWAAA